MCILSGTKIDVTAHLSRYYYKGLCVVALAGSVPPFTSSSHAKAVSAFWVLNDKKVMQTFSTLLRRQRMNEDHNAGKKHGNDGAGKKHGNDGAGKKHGNDGAGKKTAHMRLLMVKAT